jgi:hypothetical protein
MCMDSYVVRCTSTKARFSATMVTTTESNARLSCVQVLTHLLLLCTYVLCSGWPHAIHPSMSRVSRRRPAGRTSNARSSFLCLVSLFPATMRRCLAHGQASTSQLSIEKGHIFPPFGPTTPMTTRESEPSVRRFVPAYVLSALYYSLIIIIYVVLAV